MPNDLERKIASVLSKAMALICVRNTCLETLHAGPEWSATPTTIPT